MGTRDFKVPPRLSTIIDKTLFCNGRFTFHNDDDDKLYMIIALKLAYDDVDETTKPHDFFISKQIPIDWCIKNTPILPQKG